VLVVHDADIPTPESLQRRIDHFFAQLRARTEDTHSG
jgi:hypothetical protein